MPFAYPCILVLAAVPSILVAIVFREVPDCRPFFGPMTYLGRGFCYVIAPVGNAVFSLALLLIKEKIRLSSERVENIVLQVIA